MADSGGKEIKDEGRTARSCEVRSSNKSRHMDHIKQGNQNYEGRTRFT